MKIETLLIDGHEVEAMLFEGFGAFLIKGTTLDRLTLVVDSVIDDLNTWGPNKRTHDGYVDYELEAALDHFWPGWAERAS